MGERMDVQRTPETPYLRARHTVMTILNMRLFKVWLQPEFLFNLTHYAKQQNENISITHKFTDEVSFIEVFDPIKRYRISLFNLVYSTYCWET